MKKLKLNKKTISSLSKAEIPKEQIGKVQGASVVFNTCLCNDTESCTLFHQCCDPPPEQRFHEEG